MDNEEVVEEVQEETPEQSEEQEISHEQLIADLKEMKEQVGSVSQTVEQLREENALLRDLNRPQQKNEYVPFKDMPDDYIPSKAELAAELQKIEENRRAESRLSQTEVLVERMIESHPDFEEVVYENLKEIIDNPAIRKQAGFTDFKSGQELFNFLKEVESRDPAKGIRLAYEYGKRHPKYASVQKEKTTQSVLDKIEQNSKKPASLASAPVRKPPQKDAWSVSSEEFRKTFDAGRNR